MTEGLPPAPAWMADWPVANPRPDGPWHLHGPGRWGLLDPESGDVSEVDPDGDRRLPGLRSASEHGSIVGYRAGRRAVVATRTSFVKIVRPSRVAALVATHRRLENEAHGFGVPPVCSHHDDGRVELGIVAGTPLHRRLVDTPSAPLPDLGAALSALHRMPGFESAPPRVPESPERWLSTVERHPTGFHRLLTDVAATLPALDPGHGSVVHGDLHDKNVFVDGRCVSLIDFDGLGTGAAEDDVANLAVHLELRNLQAGSPLRPGQRTAELYGDYVRVAPLDGDRLRAVERHTWFRLACLYQYRTSGRALVPTMLAAAADRPNRRG